MRAGNCSRLARGPELATSFAATADEGDDEGGSDETLRCAEARRAAGVAGAGRRLGVRGAYLGKHFGRISGSDYERERVRGHAYVSL